MYGFPICLSVETLLEWISDKSLFGVVKMETQSCQAILSGQVSLSFGAKSNGEGLRDAEEAEPALLVLDRFCQNIAIYLRDDKRGWHLG